MSLRTRRTNKWVNPLETGEQKKRDEGGRRAKRCLIAVLLRR